MTDTTPTPSRARDNAAVVPAGILEHLDPNAVQRANVRDDANLDARFIASVREHTVLQPITAIRTEDGLYVRDGQRCVLAAREVALPTISVYVISAESADTNTATAEPIAQQIVTNDQRTALSPTRQASTGCFLPGFRRARSPKFSRSTAKQSPPQPPPPRRPPRWRPCSPGSSASPRQPPSRFDGNQRALSQLLDVSGTPMFDHRVAQLRQERIDAAARAQAAKAHAERGFTILDDRPDGATGPGSGCATCGPPTASKPPKTR